MDLNSAHQRWSRWTFTVTPGTRYPAPGTVRTNCARFGRKAFGAASEMRLTRRAAQWVVEVRTEGHPVHDPAYVRWMAAQWTRFFVSGFGPGTTLATTAKLEAGSRQDGTPADQLVLIPALTLDPVS